MEVLQRHSIVFAEAMVRLVHLNGQRFSFHPNYTCGWSCAHTLQVLGLQGGGLWGECGQYGQEKGREGERAGH